MGVMTTIDFSTLAFSDVVPTWAPTLTTRVTSVSLGGAVMFSWNVVVLCVSVVGFAAAGAAPAASGPETYHRTVYVTAPVGPPDRVRLYAAVWPGARDAGPVRAGTSGTCAAAGGVAIASATRRTAAPRSTARGATSPPPTGQEEPRSHRRHGGDDGRDELQVERRFVGDVRPADRDGAGGEDGHLEREETRRGDRHRVLRGRSDDHGRAARAAGRLRLEAHVRRRVRRDRDARQADVGRRPAHGAEPGDPAARREVIGVRDLHVDRLRGVSGVRDRERIVQEAAVEHARGRIEGQGEAPGADDVDLDVDAALGRTVRRRRGDEGDRAVVHEGVGGARERHDDVRAGAGG